MTATTDNSEPSALGHSGHLAAAGEQEILDIMIAVAAELDEMDRRAGRRNRPIPAYNPFKRSQK